MKTQPQSKGLGLAPTGMLTIKSVAEKVPRSPWGAPPFLTVLRVGTHSWPAAHVVETVRDGLHSQPE